MSYWSNTINITNDNVNVLISQLKAVTIKMDGEYFEAVLLNNRWNYVVTIKNGSTECDLYVDGVVDRYGYEY